ncbi:MAG: hypothetical protein RLZZ444_4133 [Pseudomonadota bacterium]|jgi:Ca2+-binding RTX toxin-like protein
MAEFIINRDFDVQSIDFDGFFSSPHISRSPTQITATYPNNVKQILIGHDFTFDNHGLPKGGTLNEIDLKVGNAFVYTLSGISTKIADIREAVLQGSEAAEERIVKDWLKGDDTISLTDRSDMFYGFGGGDTMNGYGGTDWLYGMSGDDTLKGGTGNDRLVGGVGRDTMTGGTGSDIFLFNDRDSAAARPASDIITDFSSAQQDRIDLKQIDANTKAAGDQKFTFNGDQYFHNHAGELIYKTTAGNTFVSGDTNGDGTADFTIHLSQAMVLHSSDFQL